MVVLLQWPDWFPPSPFLREPQCGVGAYPYPCAWGRLTTAPVLDNQSNPTYLTSKGLRNGIWLNTSQWDGTGVPGTSGKAVGCHFCLSTWRRMWLCLLLAAGLQPCQGWAWGRSGTVCTAEMGQPGSWTALIKPTVKPSSPLMLGYVWQCISSAKANLIQIICYLKLNISSFGGWGWGWGEISYLMFLAFRGYNEIEAPTVHFQ